MNITITNEQEILQEGVTVLIEHLGTSKTARFLSAWKQGAGDDLKRREQLFQGETVDSLYEKITKYERIPECSIGTVALEELHGFHISKNSC